MIGERIKTARDNAEMSQQKLAEIVGVKQGYISRWENNFYTPDIDSLRLIKHALDTTYDYLIDGK